MTVAVAATLLVALAIPHWLRLDAVHPFTGAALWFSNLAARALVGIYVALSVVLYVPDTGVFVVFSRWCWHAILPVLATHLRLTGHGVGDLALVGPAAILAVSLIWAGVGVLRAARAVQRMLRLLIVGAGPGDSVILGEHRVLIAVAGLRHPQVVVSAGALVALDDEELAAGLDHERGHIAHRHRFAIVAAEALSSVARFVPGTRRAHDELLFHLERDADEYALRRDHDPASLASAICKAADSMFGSREAAFATLGGGAVVRRLQMLLDQPERPRRTGTFARLSATVLCAVTLVAAFALPAAAQAGLATRASMPKHACPN